MEIEQIARDLDTQVLQPGLTGAGGAHSAVASDRMSDLLERATPSTLIVTALATRQVLDMAELMEVPAICVTVTDPVCPIFLAGALRCRVPVILSRLGPDETRRRLQPLLRTSEGAQP